MEESIGLFEAAVVFILVSAVIFVISTVLKQRSLGPSMVHSPIGVEIQVDMEGIPSYAVVSNPTEEEIKELKIVVYSENEEREFTIRDVPIKPHYVEVIDLKERMGKDVLKNAMFIEIYYKDELVARRVVG